MSVDNLRTMTRGDFFDIYVIDPPPIKYLVMLLIETSQRVEWHNILLIAGYRFIIALLMYHLILVLFGLLGYHKQD